MISGIGLYVITNADTVRETFTPTVTPLPTQNAASLAISGELFLRDGSYAEAIDAYEAALLLDDSNPEIYKSLLDLLIIEGEADRALEWAERGNLLAPEDSELWTLLAAAQMLAGDRQADMGELTEADTFYAAALRSAREAVTLDPNNARAYAYGAGAVLELEGFDGILTAQEQMEFALALAPDDPIVRRFRGALFQNQGLYGNAIEEYQIAIENTNNPTLQADLLILQARNSYALQNLSSAILYFEDAIARDAGNAAAYDGLALMYFQLGEYPKAEENAAIAKELDPTMVRAYARLGAAQYRQNNYAPAIENLSYAVDRYQTVTLDNSIFFNMLGFAYIFEEDDCSKARPLFEQVLEAIVDEPNALEGLDSCRGAG
ncbi:MAG: tetratricopeptide repeat protein [Anaerolineales bacterium]|nr:tetratricopeptide repeat protein [Anaerolineales bacterium]